MSEHPRTRAGVVAGGALLIVGCAVAAYAGASRLVTATASGGRDLMFFMMPLTALATLVAGIAFTRGMRTSTAEGCASLLTVEVAMLAFLVLAAGEVDDAVIAIWLLASLSIAPWWLLATWIGRFRMSAA